MVGKNVLSERLSQKARALLLMGATSVLFACRRSSVPSLSVLVRENR